MSLFRFFRATLLLLALLLGKEAYAQKVGVVLSGGGSRGLAHVGVLKALEENNIPIDYIAGSSMGALVGGLYVAGYTPLQIENMIKSDDFKRAAEGIISEELVYYFKQKADNGSMVNIRFTKDSAEWKTSLPTSLINPIPLDFELMEGLSAASARANYNYDSLMIPYRCTASDIEDKKLVVFKKGNLSETIRASIAFPFYIPPVVLNGHMMFDGGLYNNFPADALLTDFYPDIIIGCNVTGVNEFKPNEDNFLTQLRAMVANITDYSIQCENGVLIEPNLNDVDIFNFEPITHIINQGYVAAKAQMPVIKERIQRRMSPAELAYKRGLFLKKMKLPIVDKVDITGLNKNQSQYVKNIIKPYESRPLYMTQLKKNYFRLIADENVKRIYPKLIYNSKSGLYDLKLNVKRGNDFVAQFGGNLASRSINEGFVGLQYNYMGKRTVSVYGNSYFGKFYNSGHLDIRINISTNVPFYIEPTYTFNRWDYFSSAPTATEFIENLRPSYLIKTDQTTGLNIGLPVRNKGKFITSGSLIYISNDYYQTKQFTQLDTADNTTFSGSTLSASYERSTLNKKLYANEGTFLNIKARIVKGREIYTPGSTANQIEGVNKYHKPWYQVKFNYTNYFKHIGIVRFGFHLQGVYSEQPLFNNYLGTALSTPAFEPTVDSRTLFIQSFRAPSYGGFGLATIFQIVKNMELRLEAHNFHPFREIKSLNNQTVYYGSYFDKRYFIGSSNLIYHTPIGPISFSVNYYTEQKEPLSILFHFGYIIFNERALD